MFKMQDYSKKLRAAVLSCGNENDLLCFAQGGIAHAAETAMPRALTEEECTVMAAQIGLFLIPAQLILEALKHPRPTDFDLIQARVLSQLEGLADVDTLINAARAAAKG